MREGIPSFTAGFVSFARAVASSRPMSSPPLRDDAARALLPWPVAALVPRGSPARRWLGQTVFRAASMGLVDHLALRSAAIDDAVEDAVAVGVRQLVILGAGLDARAYRLDALRDVTVYEVDHPASQRYKRGRLAGLRPVTKSLRHVAVDFAVDDLDACLARAGHDVNAPTCWVFEGVTMYLPVAATRATLDVVARRSAEGSRVAMTYMRPPRYLLPRPARAAVDAAMAVLGEPLDAMFSPDDIAAMLRAVGFVVREDSCNTDWSARHGASAITATVFRAERLVVADRQSAQALAT